MKNKTASIILIAGNTSAEALDLCINDMFKQTYKNIEVIVTYQQNFDIEPLKNKWLPFPGQIFWVPVNDGLDFITKGIEKSTGDYIFYKTTNPVKWYPRHVESHVKLMSTHDKYKWSYSYLDFKNGNDGSQLNNMGWRIDFPNVEQFILDELVHTRDLKINWEEGITKQANGQAVFMPGLLIKQLKNYHFINPDEITIIQLMFPQGQQQIILGQPKSDEIKEGITEINNELVITREYPTIVGNVQFSQRNKEILKIVDSNTIQNIAVKRSMGLGDVILVEPVIRALKQKYKNAKVTLFTTNYASSNEITKLLKSIDKVEIIDQSNLLNDYLSTVSGYNLKFDLDLAYESSPGVRYVDCYLEVCGFEDVIEEKNGEFIVTKEFDEEFLIPKIEFESIPMVNEKYVSMTPEGSGWGGKQLDIQKWKEVIKFLNSKGYRVCLTSSSIDPKELEGLNVTTNINNDFYTLLNLIKYSQAHFGGDNAPMHIATAFRKPTFVVSGAALTKFTTAAPVKAVFLEDLKCLGCKHRFFYGMTQDGGITFVPPCENKDQFACMKGITNELLSSKLNEFFEEHKL